jgi:hypothetical protein
MPHAGHSGELIAASTKVNDRRGRPTRLLIFSHHVGVNTASDIKACCQTHEPWRGRRDEIVKNSVGHRFMKGALVTKGPDVEFQCLQFDTGLISNILKVQRCKIRLARFGAKAGELRYIDANRVITLGLRVYKGFKRLAWLSSHKNPENEQNKESLEQIGIMDKLGNEQLIMSQIPEFIEIFKKILKKCEKIYFIVTKEENRKNFSENIFF